jgi:hypothetical protein
MISEQDRKTEKQLIDSALNGMGYKVISNQDRMMPEGEYWIHIKRKEAVK